MAKLFQPEQVELSNGIPVILQNYEGPVATIYWWVKTGSADEAPSEAGFAHFLEHMLFKDAAAKESGRASTGQMARTIESLGGDINAYTSFDQTVYHVTCASQHWERVLDAFGTMAKPQKFLKEDFEREREVILEELRKNEDSPGRQLFQSLFSSTFSKHPYGKPVIGYVKTLNAAKVNELEAFYRRNYVSGNMGIILVGPLGDGPSKLKAGKKENPVSKQGARKKKILQYLEKHFGQKVLKKTAAKEVTRVREKENRSGSKWKVRPFDVKTPTVSFSFRVPELAHEDLPALDLISSILGSGELSRLYQRLFYKTSLVTEVSAGMYVPKDPGMLYFQAEVEQMDKLNEASAEMFTGIARLGNEGPTQEELNRVLVNAESERLYATQTVDGMAGRLGFLQFIVGNLTFDQDYIDELKSVTPARLKLVTRKYLSYSRLSGVVMVPKEEKDFDVSQIEKKSLEILGSDTTNVVGKSKSLFPQKAFQPRPYDAPAEMITLPSGMRVCVYPRPVSHVISIHASVLAGVRLELAHPIETAQKDWGSSFMMALSWAKGTTKRTAQQISELTEGRAASIDGYSGRNTVGVQLVGLSKDWGDLSELFSDVLLNPAFPKTEVDHARRIAEDSVRSVEDHSSQLCSKQFLETLYENHPYGKMPQGSLESLQSIHTAKLSAFHNIWVRPNRLVISVCGDVKSAELESWIQALESSMSEVNTRLIRQGESAQGISLMSEIPKRLENELPLQAPRWVEKSLKREQAHILVGGFGTDIHSEDRHAIRLLQTLLGGQSGRLFIELREKKSLAYTVSPVSFEGLETGYIGTYIACSPGKTKEAIAGIQTVLENLVKKGPGTAEMNRAKEFFMGRRAMDLQSDASLAAHYGLETLYQIPHLTDLQLAKKIKAITAKDIQDVCRKYLVEPNMVTSIVG